MPFGACFLLAFAAASLLAGPVCLDQDCHASTKHMATNDRHSLELSGNLVGLRSRRFQVRVLGSIPRTALDQIREALLITLAAGAQHPGSLDHPDDWPTHLDSSCSAAVTAEAAAVM